MTIGYKFCPNCKENLSKEEEKIYCKSCGFIHYFDVAATATAIPVKGSKILIAIRGTEPFKGKYDLIGGFVKGNESAEGAVIRETYEETGLKVKIKSYLGSYPDTYGKGGKFTLGMTYIVDIISGTPKANDDVAKLEWINIKDIPKLKNIAFKNMENTLMDFYNLFGRGAEN